MAPPPWWPSEQGPPSRSPARRRGRPGDGAGGGRPGRRGARRRGNGVRPRASGARRGFPARGRGVRRRARPCGRPRPLPRRRRRLRWPSRSRSDPPSGRRCSPRSDAVGSAGLHGLLAAEEILQPARRSRRAPWGRRAGVNGAASRRSRRGSRFSERGPRLSGRRLAGDFPEPTRFAIVRTRFAPGPWDGSPDMGGHRWTQVRAEAGTRLGPKGGALFALRPGGGARRLALAAGRAVILPIDRRTLGVGGREDVQGRLGRRGDGCGRRVRIQRKQIRGIFDRLDVLRSGGFPSLGARGLHRRGRRSRGVKTRSRGRGANRGGDGGGGRGSLDGGRVSERVLVLALRNDHFEGGRFVFAARGGSRGGRWCGGAFSKGEAVSEGGAERTILLGLGGCGRFIGGGGCTGLFWFCHVMYLVCAEAPHLALGQGSILFVSGACGARVSALKRGQ